MKLGIATDHGGFALKEELIAKLRAAGHEVTDFGAHTLNPVDDYPDFVVRSANAVTRDQLVRQVIQGGGNMPAYAKNLNPSEVTALVAFLETLHPPNRPPAKDASQPMQAPAAQSVAPKQ